MGSKLSDNTIELTNRSIDYYNKAAALIPPCNPHEEYENTHEELIWSPAPTPMKEHEETIIRSKKDENIFTLTTRLLLTVSQHKQGIPLAEAEENSCNGIAEEYITQVLHRCKYNESRTYRILAYNTVPHHLCRRWTEEDLNCFTKGLGKYKKDFSAIQKEFLPEKEMKDILEFYYSWKRAKKVKGIEASRSREVIYMGKTKKTSNYIIGPQSTVKVLTRSQHRANERKSCPGFITPI